jgi:hypothetical protein
VKNRMLEIGASGSADRPRRRRRGSAVALLYERAAIRFRDFRRPAIALFAGAAIAQQDPIAAV